MFVEIKEKKAAEVDVELIVEWMWERMQNVVHHFDRSCECRQQLIYLLELSPFYLSMRSVEICCFRFATL